jgi:hypothetical protein
VAERGTTRRAELPGAVGFGDLLALSWRLYRASWGQLMVLFVPAVVLIYVLPTGAGILLGDLAPSHTATVVALALLLAVALPTLIGSLLVAAGSVVMTDRLRGRPRMVTEVPRLLRPVRNDVLQAALFSTLMVALLSLTGILRIVAALAWGPPVLAHTICLENAPFATAWSRLRPRLAGNLLRVIAYLLLVVLALNAAGIVLFTPLALLPLPDGAASQLIGAALRGVVGAVTLSYLAAATLVIYLDLRARTEGLDLRRLRAERTRVL